MNRTPLRCVRTSESWLPLKLKECLWVTWVDGATVSFHNFKSQNVKLSVSNRQSREDCAYVRDKSLYTTTNRCLQCLLKIMYTVS